MVTIVVAGVLRALLPAPYVGESRAHCRKCSEHYGTAELLVKLALGKAENCPSSASSVVDLKRSMVAELYQDGWRLERQAGDKEDVPQSIGTSHCY